MLSSSLFHYFFLLSIWSDLYAVKNIHAVLRLIAYLKSISSSSVLFVIRVNSILSPYTKKSPNQSERSSVYVFPRVDIFQDLLSKSDGGEVVVDVVPRNFENKQKLMPICVLLLLRRRRASFVCAQITWTKPDCVCLPSKEWQDLHVGFFLCARIHRVEENTYDYFL